MGTALFNTTDVGDSGRSPFLVRLVVETNSAMALATRAVAGTMAWTPSSEQLSLNSVTGATVEAIR